MAAKAYGADEWEAGKAITDDMYSVGFDIVQVVPAPPPESGPLGACWMRCCGAWEEDENAVDWSSLADGGYQHWSEIGCRRRE